MGEYTVCPGSSDPFHTVKYYINGSILPGLRVNTFEGPTGSEKKTNYISLGLKKVIDVTL